MKVKNLLITIIAIFGLSTIVFGQTLPSYVPANGLVGWWPFNGNANDESLNGNDGTNNGATLTVDRFQNANSAYSFNGTSSFIDLSSSSFGIAGNAERSLVAWVNTSALAYRAIFSTGSGVSGNPCSNNGKTFNMKLGNTHLSFMSYNCGNCPACDFYPNSGVNVSDNVWHHLVVTLKSDTLFTFVDGVQDNFKIMSNINTSGNSNLIGKDNHIGYEDYFAGVIDDIGIWNRALSQEEISNLYNATNCSNNTGISPQTNLLPTGATANFIAITSDPNPNYVWQSDFGQGYVTLNNYGNYSGVNTNSLSISNVQLPNHTQPIRVISTSGDCIDTSNVATINITDTCIVTINDTITTLISVTDTLVINTLITGLTPPNNLNTIKVFPNPANNHITIDFGNFASMNGYSLTIINSIGQTVFTTPINQQSSYIDLSTWGGNGIYFVQIMDTQNNTIENRKIVLQ